MDVKKSKNDAKNFPRGCPAFSWYNIPKRGKMPNAHKLTNKIYQMALYNPKASTPRPFITYPNCCDSSVVKKHLKTTRFRVETC
jgi:hypothetical protein